MIFDELIQRVMQRAQQAAAARAEAERARRSQREQDDHYVTGGVNWNGYSLEHLIKMVAEQAAPQQLDALAGEWRTHGQKISQASEDLQRSLEKLMQYWSGAAADESTQKVTSNAAWINELGSTAQSMAAPIENAGGALRSAQNTMPGKPHSNWWATAGGGAAAGFAVGGPIGAAFGAALGGIASAFGFGTNKKKLKRQAVHTMERYEGALLGIDGSTPQFGTSANGSEPGPDRLRNPGPGVGTPGAPPTPPGGGLQPWNPSNGLTPISTTPSLAEGGPGPRWQGLTGLTPGGFGGEFGAGPGGRGLGLGGFPGLFPGGRGFGPGGLGGTGGRGGLAGAGGRGAGGRGAGGGRGGVGRGAYGPGGLGGRGGAGEDREYRGRRGLRGGVLGAEEESGARGRGGALGEEEEARRRGGARGRFGRGGLDPHGSSGYGTGGAGAREEEDEEHRRKFPVEEDPFSTDLKAAPPVIGI